MGLTRYPNGVTVASGTTLAYNSAAGDGDLDCNRLFTNDAQGVIGGVYAVNVQFLAASTLQIMAVAAPDFAANLVGAWVTVGSVSAIVAAYTVQGGSAGTVHVSSENNTTGVAYSKSSLAIDTPGITTTAGISVTRGVQGTAGESFVTLLFRRTA